MRFITSTYQSQGEFRSIVDESLVHCHRGCEFEPVTGAVSCFSSGFFYFDFFRVFCLFIDIFHNHLQAIWAAEYFFNPIELMHSVASCICVFVFDNVLFDGHFV